MYIELETGYLDKMMEIPLSKDGSSNTERKVMKNLAFPGILDCKS